VANRYWVGGSGTWDTTTTTNWSAAQGLSFTASCSGTTLTTVGSPALVVGMKVFSSTNVSLGTISSGSVNTWVVSVGGSYASQTMTAATVGASVPTSADSVFVATGSGTTVGTITMTGNINCLDLTTSVGNWTFSAGTTPNLSIYGSLSLISPTTFPTTNLSGINFSSTTSGKTITTNGNTLDNVTFNGVGGVWTLGSALLVANTITLTNGTFNTSASNYSVTAFNFSSSGSLARTLTLNASTFTVSSTLTAWDTSTTTNLTFNANTSTIVLSGVSGSTFSGGGLTYYNLTFNPPSGTSATRTLNGANTFNNLSLTSNVGGGYVTITIGASQTVNGLLTITAGAAVPGASRMYVSSSTYGTAITLTAASTSLVDIDFTDITGAGAASPFTGTRLGNCGGNSGITFTAAKNCYFVGTTSANWISTNWALSSGGATSTANYPLPQDTAYFDNSSLNTSATVNLSANLNLPNIDFSARTNAMTVASAAVTNIRFFGSVTLSSVVTITGTGTLNWQNRNTSTITNAAVSWPQPITINNLTGTVRLLDAFTSTNATTALTLTSGTFDANGFNFTGVKVVATGSTTRTLAIGSGTWTISGVTTTTWSVASTGLTVTGSGTISMTGATAKTFAGGGVNYGSVALNQGGAGTLTVTGSNTFGDITNTYSATGATTILFTSGTTQTVAAFTAVGTSGKLLTLNAVTSGSAFTLSKSGGTVSSDYLSLKDSTATGGAGWYAGANSTNTSGNTGWIFAAAPVTTGNFFFLM